MICPNCGKEVDNNTILCPNCSYNIQADNQKLSVINSDEFKGTMKKGFTLIKLIIAAPFLFVGLIMLIPALSSGLKAITYEKTDAILVNYETASIGVCGVYSYQVDGITYEMNSSVCEGNVEDLEKVHPIMYDKNSPSKAVDGFNTEIPFLIIGVVIMSIGLVIIFFGKILKFFTTKMTANISIN